MSEALLEIMEPTIIEIRRQAKDEGIRYLVDAFRDYGHSDDEIKAAIIKNIICLRRKWFRICKSCFKENKGKKDYNVPDSYWKKLHLIRFLYLASFFRFY